MGAYHTVDLKLNEKFKLEKECWDLIYLDILDEACNIERTADLAIVLMELGRAHLFLVNGNMTRERAKIEQNIPHKKLGSNTQYEKSVQRFYNSIYSSILTHVNFDIVKVVILASSAFVKDEFYDFMMEEAVKKDNRILQSNKDKFMKLHVTNGHRSSLDV